ncbi:MULTISPECIES: DUF6553 family protein [unclassified Butyrivibrio]|jgi:hypothetical protein|uniref:DUF6553 family protein n=1 Tax=unclassified Butyrivibrio TaxID=2639466 RepID=UPI0003B53B76|nr:MULTISPECIES: DUF6553 family protein [unclassified Butyrivibrio]
MINNEAENKYAEEMKAWLMIQVIGRTSINIFNSKKLRREMEDHLDVLLSPGITGDVNAKLLDFADYFIDSCLSSKAYSTAVFGIMSMSEAGAATRLAQDILEITHDIPKRFGFEEKSVLIRNAFLTKFTEKIQGANKILAELGVEPVRE